jgi:conjugal transfer ATP-binding protein TraC
MSFLGLSFNKLEKDLRRSNFSKYIPLLFHKKDDEQGGDIFLNQDNTIGYAWELSPVAFLSDKQASTLEQILNTNFPKGTVLQFILHADENIEPIIEKYLKGKTLKDELIQTSVNQYADFLRKEASGMKKMGGMPIRNYRSFLFVKSPDVIDKNTIASIEESLTTANLSPEKMSAKELISWFRQMFNSEYENPLDVYIDEEKPLYDQIIKSDTIIEFDDEESFLGDKYVSVITPKELGSNVDTLSFNRMFGGFAKSTEDNSQILSPYVFSMNIVLDEVKSEISRKTNIIMSQKFGGSLASALNKRIREFSRVTSEIDDNKKQIKMIPSLFVYDTNHKKLTTSISRIRNNWNSSDSGASWKMQIETKISKICFVMSLPFGLYNVGKNIKMIDRDFINSTEAISRMLPVQAEFKGSIYDPSTLYLCRRGQLAGVNIGHTTTSMNFLVSAESGGGKSYFLNKFLQDERARESKVRVLDIGGSYKKMALANSGRYIDFESEDICINPLDFKVPLDNNGAIDSEDYDKARDMAVIILGEMVYSASGDKMSEMEFTLMKMATDWVLDDDNRKVKGVDSVVDYLINIEKMLPNPTDKIKKTSQEMAFNLYDFSSKGKYGKYFCRPSNFDITNDEFVVIELERVRARRELFSVVVMQMLNLVTADLYLGDRSTRTFCLFEEVASLLNKQGQKDLSQLATIINEGYRRARKYAGCFGVVLQSLLDLQKFGTLGDVVRENSAYKFLLQGKTYVEASEKKLIPYKGLALELVDSTKNNKPRYSEVFVDSPFGLGVYRLYVDAWTSALCSSEPADTAKFERLLKQGKTPLEAISEISGIEI